MIRILQHEVDPIRRGVGFHITAPPHVVEAMGYRMRGGRPVGEMVRVQHVDHVVREGRGYLVLPQGETTRIEYVLHATEVAHVGAIMIIPVGAPHFVVQIVDDLEAAAPGAPDVWFTTLPEKDDEALARDEALDRIALSYNARRQPGETDEQLRARLTRQLREPMRGTAESIREAVESIEHVLSCEVNEEVHGRGRHQVVLDVRLSHRAHHVGATRLRELIERTVREHAPAGIDVDIRCTVEIEWSYPRYVGSD